MTGHNNTVIVLVLAVLMKYVLVQTGIDFRLPGHRFAFLSLASLFVGKVSGGD